MITLYLVRHAETLNNAEGITQGQTDSLLSENGAKQAELLGEALKSIKIDKIFCSDLGRVLDTAKHVTKYHKVPVVKSTVLRERSKGEWEGVKKSDILKHNPDLERLWAQEVDVRPPNGENFEDVHNRIIPFVNDAIKNGKDQTLLFICHGTVNRIIIGHFLDIPHGLRYRIAQDYCAMSKIVIDGRKISIEYVNDTAHLREAEQQ